jgi:hypothetical protein
MSSLFGGGDNSAKKANKLSREQFQYQKDQATKAEADAATKRASLEKGMGDISNIFSQYNDPYYANVSENYRQYANPQIEKSFTESNRNITSNLANRGKLGSSTAASQYGDLANSYGSIRQQSEMKAQDYANQQRQAINQARSQTVGQLYSSESPQAALQSANAFVPALNAGPSFSAIGDILNQASKFASQDYVNAQFKPQGGLLFSNQYTGNSYGNPNVNKQNNVSTYTGY